MIKGDLKMPDTTPPTVNVTKPKFLPPASKPAALRATWLGHACYFVEFPSGLRGPFDLGLIPVGAYQPRRAFSSMHASPADAVEIFRDTGCRRAMGLHWGTWALTMVEVLEPPVLLKEAMKRRGMPEVGVFDACDIGESREF